MPDLTKCESVAVAILEAYDSQPPGHGDDWLEGEWSFGTGERCACGAARGPGPESVGCMATYSTGWYPGRTSLSIGGS